MGYSLGVMVVVILGLFQLYPVTHAPDPSIIKASADLIEKHKKDYPNERQLLQVGPASC